MKRRYIISIAAAALILAVWFLFLIIPQMKKRNEIRVALAESESRIEDFREIMVRIPEYFDARQHLSQRKKHLISMLYSKDDLLRLFDDMTEKLSKHDLVLVEISPSLVELLAMNKQMPDEYEPQLLDINIRLSGPLQSIGQFVREVESQNFYKGMNFFRISNPAEDRRFSDVSYSFKAILGTIKDS